VREVERLLAEETKRREEADRKLAEEAMKRKKIFCNFAKL